MFLKVEGKIKTFLVRYGFDSMKRGSENFSDFLERGTLWGSTFFRGSRGNWGLPFKGRVSSCLGD